MGTKTGVHKLSRKKESAVKAPIPKHRGSTKKPGADKKREAELHTLIEKNLDAHFKSIGYVERPARPLKKIWPLLMAELESGWWPENIWIWKSGLNRAEVDILRKELVRRLK